MLIYNLLVQLNFDIAKYVENIFKINVETTIL